MSLPAWVETGGINECDCEGCDYVVHLKEALSIAWDGMERAKRWNDVKGLSAEAALREACNDIQQAMRRIGYLGETK